MNRLLLFASVLGLLPAVSTAQVDAAAKVPNPAEARFAKLTSEFDAASAAYRSGGNEIEDVRGAAAAVQGGSHESAGRVDVEGIDTGAGGDGGEPERGAVEVIGVTSAAVAGAAAH